MEDTSFKLQRRIKNLLSALKTCCCTPLIFRSYSTFFHNSSYPLMFMIMKGILSPGYYFYCIQGQQGYSGLHTNYEIDYWAMQPYCNHVAPLWYVKLFLEYRKCHPIDLLQKSPSAAVPYPIMHHFVTEMCTCVHISITKWSIVGYLSTAL